MTTATPTIAPGQDAARFLRGVTDDEIRFAFLTYRWPSADELADLRRRHAADPALCRLPLVDVLHALLGLGVPDRRVSSPARWRD